VTELLANVDRTIERHAAALTRDGREPILVVWSDHGHHDVRRLNPLRFLKDRGIDLSRHTYVIDTNFIRFWVDDPDERRRLAMELDSLGIGHVLTESELDAYRVRMADDRYGNVIFYVELPYALSHTIWGFGRRLASGHGYLPDHPGSDAVFVSNLPTREGQLDLVDVAPSLLELLGLTVDPGLDGRSVWIDR
jgi:arylsulfatase A-like enzyme